MWMADKKQSKADAAPQADRPADGSQRDKIELTEHLHKYFRILIEWDQRAKERETKELLLQIQEADSSLCKPQE